MSTGFLPPDWRDRLKQHRQVPRPRWMRITGWIWLGITALTLVVAIAVTVLLNNQRFHNYLIRKVEANATESLGVRVQLQNFALHLQTLSVDLYGITVDGASPYSDPPLLQVDHIEAGVRIVSILHRAWYFDNLRIDRPIAHVFVDDNGISNIPALKSSNGSPGTSVFDLGIRHALLTQGEVYYNNRPSTLEIDLHDVEFRSSFNTLAKKYSGKIAYSNGNLIFGTFRPFTHSLDAQFDATPTEFDLTQSKLAGAGSEVSLTATLHNYTTPDIQAHYDLTVDGKQLAALLHNSSLPEGMIRANGSIQYQEAADKPVLDSIVVDGDLASQRLEVRRPSLRAVIQDFHAHYSLANGDAALQDLHAKLLGGQLAAQGTMKGIAGNSHTDLTGTLRGISLAQVRQLLGPSASSPNVSLAGVVNANFTAEWGRTIDDLVAHADATIASQVHGGQKTASPLTPQVSAHVVDNPAETPSIPVDGEIHATYAAKDGQLEMVNSYFRTPHTDLTLNGVVSKHSNLALRLQAQDLHEVETIADMFLAQSNGKPLQPFGLSGTASFQGSVQGSTTEPHLSGLLTATDLHYNGTVWKTLRTNVDLSPFLASLQHAELELNPHGHVSFNASAGLSSWSLTNASPLRIDLHASDLNIADLAKLANQPIPVTGTLSAGITLRGTKLNPEGSGSVTLTEAAAYEQPVNSARLVFSGDGNQVNGDLSVLLPAGTMHGEATVRPAEKTYNASITAHGIQLDKLQALKAKNVNLTGAFALDAKGQGSFDNPQMNATIEIPTLGVESQTVRDIKLQMDVADHAVNAALTSSAFNTSIQAKARVSLSGDYLADASFDTQGIPLQPLLAAYAPGPAADMTGQTEVHATLHGPLKDKELLEANITIPVLKLAYGNSVQLAAASPIRVVYKNGRLDVQRSSIRGTDTDLEFQGSIPVAGNGPMSLVLLGTVDLQLAQLFDADIRSSGQIRFKINSSGPADSADIGGQIEIVDANFASADLPVALQNGKGILTLTKDRLNISSFSGVIGGGTVTAQGGVAYRPGIQFDLGMAAKGIRILYPQGMRETVDANLRLAGTADNAVLGGSVNLADLSFTPAFDLTNFINQFSGGVTAPPSQGIAQNTQLNIALHSTSNVNLVSRTLSIGGSANLQVRGTAAEPVILGRVNLSSGDIILNGNRFVLNGGTIQFVNPAETQPVVHLSLNTSIQQYSIDLRFQGPVDQLRTEYSSNPALPSADIINLLAFGETTEASAQAATPTNQAAESLVASQVSSQVTSRLSKVAGISQLSISPVLAGSNSQGPPGATITIQQRVTGNLFVNFSTNVASTQSQTIQGQYRISPRVSLSATRDPNGGFGFDTLIKKSW
jgi:translocation and assembly module TamB